MYKNYEEKGEYICLIQIKENSYNDIEIHIFKTLSSSPIEKQINMKIGNKLIINNVDLVSKKFVIQRTFIKIKKNGNVYHSEKNPICLISDEGCNFKFLNEIIFFEKFLKINFFLTKKPISDKLLPSSKLFSNKDLSTSFNQQYSSKIYSNNCVPQCVNGACLNDKCYCEFGYIGINCSVQLTSHKKGYFILILFLLVAFIIGVCLGCSCSICCSKLFKIGDPQDDIPEFQYLKNGEEYKLQE